MGSILWGRMFIRKENSENMEIIIQTKVRTPTITQMLGDMPLGWRREFFARVLGKYAFRVSSLVYLIRQ